MSAVGTVLDALGSLCWLGTMIFVAVRYTRGWRLRWHRPEEQR